MDQLLPALALLACPVGMGAMMWIMMRGNRARRPGPREMSLDELRAEQARLQAEMDRAAAREEARS